MSARTYLFVAGLHRSGTSLLFQLLREHPDVSGFRDTGVREDEGQHLQHTYAPANVFGGAGRFAFDARAHLGEVAPEVAAADRASLLASWGPHWDLTRAVLVEKSPPNLIRMRYLQSVFPEARFVVIVRHPVTTALATKKWRRRETLYSLIRHWIVAHDIALADAAHVDRVVFLRYERLVGDPAARLEHVQRFAGLTPDVSAVDGAVDTSKSHAYAATWRRMLANPFTKPYVRVLSKRFGADIARYGYRIDDLDALDPWSAET